MTQGTEAGPAPTGPDPATFDFMAYIAGNSTFPEFAHTVYLDQANGIALNEVAAEYDKLASRAKEIQKVQEQIAESSVRSLVDEQAEELTEELRQIEEQCTALEPQVAELEKKIRASSMTLHFQAGTAQKLGQVVRQAEKEYHKKHGKKDENDVEYVTGKSRYVLAAQLTAYCVKVSLPDGRTAPAPDRDGFEKLLDSLITSETVRLMTTLNKSLDASVDWAERIDAGFPGGRDEQGQQPLGGAPAADRPGLDVATPDPSDW